MSVLRVIAVLSLIAMLTGCIIEDLKSDIKALKVYLASTPVPDQCKPPAQHESSKRCLYKLLITDDKDKANGNFSGRIHPDVYKANATDCPVINSHLLPEYKSLAYDCAPLNTDFSKNSRFYPDTETEYTFYVEGHPMLSVGDSAEFESIPGSKHLKHLSKK